MLLYYCARWWVGLKLFYYTHSIMSTILSFLYVFCHYTDEKVVLSPHDAVKVDHHLQDIVKVVLQHQGDTRDKKVVLHLCLLHVNLLAQVLGQLITKMLLKK